MRLTRQRALIPKVLVPRFHGSLPSSPMVTWHQGPKEHTTSCGHQIGEEPVCAPSGPRQGLAALAHRSRAQKDFINDIADQAERFRRNDHLAIPIAAVLAHGRKPTE